MMIVPLKVAYLSPLKERVPAKIVSYFGFIPQCIPLFILSRCETKKRPVAGSLAPEIFRYFKLVKCN